MFWVKRHGKVLAVCDEDLIGKKILSEKCALEIKERFYKGELINEKELKELLLTNGNINLVGKKAVKSAEKLGLIAQVKKIKGVPHAIILKV